MRAWEDEKKNKAHRNNFDTTRGKGEVKGEKGYEERECIESHGSLTLFSFDILHRITKFTNVRNITLFFPDNFGNDTSIIRFIGFKGEWSEVREGGLGHVSFYLGTYGVKICGMIDQTRSNHNRLVWTGVEKGSASL